MDAMDVDTDDVDAGVAAGLTQTTAPPFVPASVDVYGDPIAPQRFNGVWVERRFYKTTEDAVLVDLSPIALQIMEADALPGLKQMCAGRALFSHLLCAATWGAHVVSPWIIDNSLAPPVGYAVVDAVPALVTLQSIIRAGGTRLPIGLKAPTPGNLRISQPTFNRLHSLLLDRQLEPSALVGRLPPVVHFSNDISMAILKGNDSRFLKTSTARWINAFRRCMPAITRGFVEGFSRRVWPAMRLLLPLQEKIERVCWLLAWRQAWRTKDDTQWNDEELAAATKPIMEFSDADMVTHAVNFQTSSTYRDTVIVAALLSLASLGIGYKVDRANRTRNMFRLPMQHQRETFHEVIANSPMRSPVHAYAILRAVVALNAVTRIASGSFFDEHAAPPEPLFDFGVFLLSRWYSELFGVIFTALTSGHGNTPTKTNDEWGRLCASLTLQWIPENTWRFASGALCPILPEHMTEVLAEINAKKTIASCLFFENEEYPNSHLGSFLAAHYLDDPDILFVPEERARVLPDINLIAVNSPTLRLPAAIAFYTRQMLAETTNAAILLLDWIQSFVGETSAKNAIQRNTNDTWLLNRQQTIPAPIDRKYTCRVCGKQTEAAEEVTLAAATERKGDTTVSQERLHYASMLDIAFERFIAGVRRTTMAQGTIERSVAVDVCTGVHSVLTSYIKCTNCITDALVPTTAHKQRPKFAMRRIFREGAMNVFPLLPRERLDGSGTAPTKAYIERRD